MTAPIAPVHRHECESWRLSGECERLPCICRCGAVLAMGPTYEKDGHWAWKMPDGSFEKMV